MPRKKKIPAETTSVTLTAPTEEVSNVTTTDVTTIVPMSTEPPPFDPTGTYRPEANVADAPPITSRGRFRSWTTDTSCGYTKLTDQEKQRIVLLFDEKPGEDVRTAMKGAGFQYQPDYHGYKNAWTRRNDHEGRIQVEAIEKLIHGQGPQSPEL